MFTALRYMDSSTYRLSCDSIKAAACSTSVMYVCTGIFLDNPPRAFFGRLQCTHMPSKREIFSDQIEEKGSYYNFLKDFERLPTEREGVAKITRW
jgi:hypothetical protein